MFRVHALRQTSDREKLYLIDSEGVVVASRHPGSWTVFMGCVSVVFLFADTPSPVFQSITNGLCEHRSAFELPSNLGTSLGLIRPRGSLAY